MQTGNDLPPGWLGRVKKHKVKFKTAVIEVQI